MTSSCYEWGSDLLIQLTFQSEVAELRHVQWLSAELKYILNSYLTTDITLIQVDKNEVTRVKSEVVRVKKFLIDKNNSF